MNNVLSMPLQALQKVLYRQCEIGKLKQNEKRLSNLQTDTMTLDFCDCFSQLKLGQFDRSVLKENKTYHFRCAFFFSNEKRQNCVYTTVLSYPFRCIVS